MRLSFKPTYGTIYEFLSIPKALDFLGYPFRPTYNYPPGGPYILKDLVSSLAVTGFLNERPVFARVCY